MELLNNETRLLLRDGKKNTIKKTWLYGNIHWNTLSEALDAITVNRQHIQFDSRRRHGLTRSLTDMAKMEVHSGNHDPLKCWTKTNEAGRVSSPLQQPATSVFFKPARSHDDLKVTWHSGACFLRVEFIYSSIFFSFTYMWAQDKQTHTK